MKKRTYATKIVGLIARIGFIKTIKELELNGYELNKELKNSLAREQKRVDRDNVEDFVTVTYSDGKSDTFDMVTWFSKAQDDLLNLAVKYRTTAVNKAVDIISSGELENGVTFKVERN